jgi:hypothetical protein
MKKWTMTTKDFHHLLEVEQEFRCALTGLDLTPDTVTIVHKIPMKKGGKHVLANVHLVHKSIAKLAKDHTLDELLVISQAVVKHLRGKVKHDG